MQKRGTGEEREGRRKKKKKKKSRVRKSFSDCDLVRNDLTIMSLWNGLLFAFDCAFVADERSLRSLSIEVSIYGSDSFDLYPIHRVLSSTVFSIEAYRPMKYYTIFEGIHFNRSRRPAGVRYDWSTLLFLLKSSRSSYTGVTFMPPSLRTLHSPQVGYVARPQWREARERRMDACQRTWPFIDEEYPFDVEVMRNQNGNFLATCSGKTLC